MGGRRWTGALVGGLVALVLLGGTGVARADEPANPQAPGQVLVDLCRSSGLAALDGADALCTTLEAGAVLAAGLCGQLGLPPEVCADLTDGRPIRPEAVDAFEQGWVRRALRLQARLDDDLPLRDAPIPHTHNSFNAPQYGPSLTTYDPNQRYTLTDQLRMGIRALELDVHWLPDPRALLRGGFAVNVCHGQTTDVAGLRIHVGCTLDRPLGDALAEIAAFLEAPGNEQEVLLLYLQNELDGNPAAHAATVAALEAHLGPLVLRPDGTEPGTCTDLPLDRSRADIRATGARVVLVGNCGPGPWSSWVFQRGDGWDERANTAGYPSFPECEADRAARGYDDHLIRVTEDRTWLSAIAATPAPITEAEVRSMVRCGVELIGLDRIGPADPRLAALVWSWAPDEPSSAGTCAAWNTDARFVASDCAVPRRPACQVVGGSWVVPPSSVAWSAADAACAAVDATFAVPRTGWDNEQLRAAAPAATELWLDLAETGDGWVPDPSVPPVALTAPAVAQASVPHDPVSPARVAAAGAADAVGAALDERAASSSRGLAAPLAAAALVAAVGALAVQRRRPST